MRALTEHRSLLLQKRERLDQLIDLVSNAMKGEKTMEFKPFDSSKYDEMREQYAEEAKARWGNTEAYRESACARCQMDGCGQSADGERSPARSFPDLPRSSEPTRRMRAYRRLSAAGRRSSAKAITDCTNEILAGLGQMYIADERFTKNIDQFGAGTAKLMSDAIAFYCAKTK